LLVRWQSHQNDFTNWPVSDFWNGTVRFFVGQYQEASKSFELVLQLDPAADESRALAIGCDWEIGETNKAITLAKGFKNPDARWAKWAAAKAELESGNVSNATVQFAFLAKNIPAMFFLPKQESQFWRKTDWDLFNKLVKTEKP
jgi:hypothetical protein